MIGVLMSATLPARLGEPAQGDGARAAHRAHARDLPGAARDPGLADGPQHRRAGRLGAIIVSTTDLFHSSTQKLFAVQLRPAAAAGRGPARADPRCAPAAAAGSPALGAERSRRRCSRCAAACASSATRAAARSPPRAQFGAWALQLAACWALFAALGLEHQAGIGAAAAVLFAVNVTAVVPADPVEHRRSSSSP